MSKLGLWKIRSQENINRSNGAASITLPPEMWIDINKFLLELIEVVDKQQGIIEALTGIKTERLK